MAKNRVQQSETVKNREEEFDFGYVSYQDYLDSPAYRAYLAARQRSMAAADEAYARHADFYQNHPGYAAGDIMRHAPYAKKQIEPTVIVKGAKYDKKRGLFLALIALLMLLLVLIIAIGAVGLPAIEQYTAAYNTDGFAIGLPDPTLGLIKRFLNFGGTSLYYNNYLRTVSEDADGLTAAFTYAVPVAAFCMLALAVIGFIKAFSALFSGKKANGLYKKCKFGLLSILLIISAVIMSFGGFLVTGAKFSGFMDYLLLRSPEMQMGFGLYAAMGIGVLTLIFTCLTYRKKH